MIRMVLFFASAVCFMLTSFDVGAQRLGGQTNYSFLEIPVSARLTALSENIGVKDQDNNLALRNPALLNAKMDNQISFSTLFHFADIRSSFFNYSHNIAPWGATLHAGVQLTDYGELTARDERSVDQGQFEAKDLSFHIGGAYQLYEKMSLGANIKYINSSIENYKSTALAFDLGAVYSIEKKRLNIGLTANNVGWVIKDYSETSQSKLPTNIQLSYVQSLEHLPLRYSITYHHLNAWNLNYSDDSGDDNSDFFTDSSVRENNFGTTLLKHFIVGAELLLGAKETVVLRASYDYLRRQELKLQEYGGLMGFSFGVGIRISKFRLDYGRAIYHQAGANNHISFSTNINAFTKDVAID